MGMPNGELLRRIAELKVEGGSAGGAGVVG